MNIIKGLLIICVISLTMITDTYGHSSQHANSGRLNQTEIKKLDKVIEGIEDKKNSLSKIQYDNFISSITDKIGYIHNELTKLEGKWGDIDYSSNILSIDINSVSSIDKLIEVIKNKRNKMSQIAYFNMLGLINEKIGYLYDELLKVSAMTRVEKVSKINISSKDENIETKKGKLMEFHVDNIDNTTNNIFVFEDDKYIQYKVKYDKTLAKSIPLNKNIELGFSKTNGTLEINKNEEGKVEYKSLTGTASNKSAVVDQTVKNIAIFHPTHTKPGITQGGRIPITNTGKEIKNYFTEVSNGEWIVNVEEYDVMTDDQTLSQGVNKLIQNLGLSDITNVVLLGTTGPCGGGAAGCGEVGERTTWIGSPSLYVFLHELGHNYGLGHANSVSNNGRIGEYSDGSTIMGAGSTAWLNAPQLVYLSFNNPSKTKEINSTQKVFLAPIELDLADIPEGVDQIIKMKDYYISTRINRPESVQINSFAGYSYLYSTASIGDSYITNLKAGGLSSYENTNPIKIEPVKFQDGILELDIYYNIDDGTPQNKPFPKDELFKCQGETPIYSSSCNGTLSGLEANTNKSAVNTCNTSNKCEFRCNTGYKATADGLNCEEEDFSEFVCTGPALKNTNACPGNQYGLEEDTQRVLVENCSYQASCEYVCDEESIFSNTSQQCERKIEIVSWDNYPNAVISNPVSHKFNMSWETIIWKVKNAGENAKGCIEYSAEDGSRNNIGLCSDLENFMVMQNNKEWLHYSYERRGKTYEQWTLTQKLSENTYYIPGDYKMFWYNPDTGETATWEFTLFE